MALFLDRRMKKVAILGRRGSFHEEAAMAFYQDVPLELKGFGSFEQMLAAYDSADVDAVVIAVENTLSGGLVRNLELIHSGGYQVAGEVHIPVHHYLMALPGQTLESIREVRSHEMALYQTRSFFEKHCPGVTLNKTSSTVTGVQEIVSGQLKGVAAVASRLAAKEFGMEILAREIESSKENMTRFFVIDRYFRSEKADKASWCFTLPHKAGALAQILTILSFYARGSISSMRTSVSTIPSAIGRRFRQSGPFWRTWMSWEFTRVVFEFHKNVKI